MINWYTHHDQSIKNEIALSVNWYFQLKNLKRLKIPNYFKPTKERLCFKTLGTSIIYNPMTPPFFHENSSLHIISPSQDYTLCANRENILAKKD